MDTHTLAAQDLLPSGAHSYDEPDHEPSQPRNTDNHDPRPGSGHAEVDAETASLPSADGFAPEAAEPLTMPGEHGAAADDIHPPVAPVPAATISSRNALIGTALALTLMVGGGGLYILFHRGHSVRMVEMPPPWHPTEVTRNPASPVNLLATNPFPSPPQHAVQAHVETDEILAMRHRDDTRPAAAVPLPPVAPAAPVIVASSPTAAAAVAVPRHPDPVTTALALRAAPMARAQEVDVLSLVTQLAALVRDIRTENAQLRDKVASLDDMVKAESSDVTQRLSLMEARKAIASAQDAGKPQLPASPGSEAAAPARVAQSGTIVPVPAPVRSVRDYRVQAASPGLAILADLNALPGQSAGLQVTVGTLVPGIGRVTSIGQRGTTWVVQTNHGAIQ